MKISRREDGFLIEPETEFEEAFLLAFNNGVTGFIKTGMTGSQIVGLVVKPKTEEVSVDEEPPEVYPTVLDIPFKFPGVFPSPPFISFSDTTIYDNTCMHTQCTECHGTGKKSDGSSCFHYIVCNCPKCSRINCTHKVQ